MWYNINSEQPFSHRYLQAIYIISLFSLLYPFVMCYIWCTHAMCTLNVDQRYEGSRCLKIHIMYCCPASNMHGMTWKLAVYQTAGRFGQKGQPFLWIVMLAIGRLQWFNVGVSLNSTFPLNESKQTNNEKISVSQMYLYIVPFCENVVRQWNTRYHQWHPWFSSTVFARSFTHVSRLRFRLSLAALGRREWWWSHSVDGSMWYWTQQPMENKKKYR